MSAHVLDRIAERFGVADSGCWEWTGAVASTGYGTLGPRLAHRVVYEAVVGPIPDGLVIDHLCDNRRCVNPDHLDPTTHQANIIRGTSPNAVAHRTGVCRNGHTLVTTATRRYCRICATTNQRRSRQIGGMT